MIFKHFSIRFTKCLLLTSVCIIGLIGSRVHSHDRVISLKPNITEILFALGVEDQVVGVTTYCKYPKEKRVISPVADYVHVDVEKVLVLKPTVVFGSKENSIKKEIEFLKRQGIEVQLLPFDRISETYTSIKKMAKRLNQLEKGKALVGEIQKELSLLAKKGTGENPRVLAVVGSRPLMVVGSNNIIDDLFDVLNIENVAGRSRLRYPTYSLEQLMVSQPEVIVDLTMGSERKGIKKAKSWYQQFQSVPAVKNDRIYFMDVGDFLASPRIVLGAKKLAAILGSNSSLQLRESGER